MKSTQVVAVVVALVAVGGLVAAELGRADELDDADVALVEAQPTSGAPPTTTTTTNNNNNATTTVPLPEAPPVLGVAGDLVDLDGWLQTDNTDFDDFDDTVRVVQFWTFSCINCKNTLDNLRSLYQEFEPRGLEVIGVHAPEFAFEEDPAAVAQAALDLNVTWPIALDTNKTNFRSWQTGRRFWPRTFVLDRDGNIRFDRIGEGAYDELNATVAFLIANPEA